MAFSLISSMVLDLLDQMHIFSQLYLVRAFSRSGITGTVRLDISKAFDRVWHDGLIEFQVRHLALFLLFSVLNSFKWFWMEVFTGISG